MWNRGNYVSPRSPPPRGGHKGHIDKTEVYYQKESSRDMEGEELEAMEVDPTVRDAILREIEVSPVPGPSMYLDVTERTPTPARSLGGLPVEPREGRSTDGADNYGEVDLEYPEELSAAFRDAKHGLTEDGAAAVVAIRRYRVEIADLEDLLLEGKIDAEYAGGREGAPFNFNFYAPEEEGVEWPERRKELDGGEVGC